jgi:hypothetical protein
MQRTGTTCAHVADVATWFAEAADEMTLRARFKHQRAGSIRAAGLIRWQWSGFNCCDAGGMREDQTRY